MTLNGSMKKSILNTDGKLKFYLSLCAVAVVLMCAGKPPPLNAGDSIVIADVNADLTSSAQITISPTSISFPNANPGVVQNIPANENPVSVTASIQIEDGKPATLTALAGGDLVSGGNSIAINRVSWTATGSPGTNGGLIAGTMNKDTAQLAGSWTQSGTYNGAFSFYLANSWSYATGSYSQTVIYTISAP